MTLSFIFLVIIFYSFAGWVMEVIYTFIVQRRFVNHGFLHGPLCPIYGAGAFLVLVVLKPFGGNIFLLGLMGMVSATALEYATSWVMEKLFHTRWWDYSQNKFNLNGRVCLQNSIAFGILSIVIIRFLQPQVVRLLSLVNSRTQDGLALAIFILAFVDCCFTLAVLLRLDKKIAQIKTFVDEIFQKAEGSEWFDPYNLKKSYARLQKIAQDEKTEAHELQLENFRAVIKQSDGVNRLFNSFPKMKNNKHGFSLNSFNHYQNNQRKR